MNYRITKADLENELLFDTLEALQGGMNTLRLPLYIVGATARDIAMRILNVEQSARRTIDLDVAIALSDWSQFDLIKEELLKRHFIKDSAKQRFFYKGSNNGFEVDVVPFGGIEQDEIIGWPPEGNPQMSVRCFRDVMSHADTISIDDLFEIKMAPLSGQFLIKLDTWMDRHLSTDKDARDMLFILENFYLAKISTCDSAPKEVDITDDFDTLVWGARWMACELREMLSQEHIAYYAKYLEMELLAEESSTLVSHFVKYMPSGGSYDQIRRALNDFVLTLTSRL